MGLYYESVGLSDGGNTGVAGGSSVYSESAHLPLVMRLWHGQHAEASPRDPGRGFVFHLGRGVGVTAGGFLGRSMGPLLRDETGLIRPYAITKSETEKAKHGDRHAVRGFGFA